MKDKNRLEVTFQAAMFSTRIPFRYRVELWVEHINTGLGATVWGRKRADKAMQHFIDNGEALLNRFGLADRLVAEIFAKRREEAMAKVQVGDRVRLLVDVGPFKKGRVCRVVKIAEPSLYASRGENAWDDDKYPIAVVPVYASGDQVVLGPNDYLPLQRGEFGPLDQEV